MTAEEKYREILCQYNKGLYIIETLELSHSLFTQSYYLTREPSGLTAYDENGVQRTFTGTSINIILNSKKSDLDANFSFTIPDPTNILDDEIDRLPLDNDEKVLCKYRVYNSDDLTEPAFYVNLSVFDVSQQKGIFTITAGADLLNFSKTGEVYDYNRFPMLRAL